MRVPAWLVYVLTMVPLWLVAAGSFDAVQLAWALLVTAATLPLSWRLFDLGRIVPVRPIVRGVVGTIRIFFFSFVPDAVHSSLEMARRVVQPVVPMQPGVVAVPLRFHGPVDELIVSNHIMLTPGQILVEVDAERGLVFVHSIDASDPERIRREVQELHRMAIRRLYG